MRQVTFSLNPHLIGKGDHHLSGSGWNQTTSTVDEFLTHTAHKGEAVMPGLLNKSGKNNDHITGFDSLIIDVDNDDPASMTSWDDALNHPFLKSNAAAMWTSPNHQLNDGSSKYRGQDRFRVLFILPKRMMVCPAGNPNDLKEVNNLIQRLNALIPGSDPKIKAGHYLAGTVNAKLYSFGDNVLDLDQVPALVVKRRVHNHNNNNEASTFNGTVEDSINNIKRWLPFIDPNDYSTWLAVAGSLKNASDLIGEEIALELFLEWSSGYHSYDERENLRMWDRFEVGTGGFLKLKELAMDGGYEQKSTLDVVDPSSLFDTTDGYKVGDVVPVSDSLRSPPKYQPSASIKSSKVKMNGEWVDVCWMTDLNGDRHDITYAHNKNLMNKHLIKAVDVVAQDSHFRFDVANQLVIRDGERVPEKQLKTIHLVLSNEYGINFPESTKGAIEAIAMRDCFDPYVDELLDIEQRVTPIDISNIATRYFKASSPLADVMMEKWLVGLVGRLLDPGLPLRGVLVLVGAQHIGKDGFLNVLTQQRVKSVGRDSKLKDRDFLLAANSCWVVNLAEIENITRSQATGELKSWITESKDIYTLKYENQASSFPRRFSLYGSCNTAKFLQDPSGNTRYWVIESPLTRENKVDLKLLESERESILAGALQLYRKYQRGEYEIELDDQQSMISEAHNSGYIEDAAFVMDLQDFLDGRTCTTKAEVYDHLGIDQAGQKANKNITNQVDLSLAQLGFFPQRTPRKVRKSGYEDVQLRVMTKGDDFDLSELHSFLMKPGQKWYHGSVDF